MCGQFPIVWTFLIAFNSLESLDNLASLGSGVWRVVRCCKCPQPECRSKKGLTKCQSSAQQQCAVCSLQCVLCIVCCAVCSVQCAVCSVLCALCVVQCVVCSRAIFCSLTHKEPEPCLPPGLQWKYPQNLRHLKPLQTCAK